MFTGRSKQPLEDTWQTPRHGQETGTKGNFATLQDHLAQNKCFYRKGKGRRNRPKKRQEDNIKE